ncbi:MAG: ketopantoate reductase family protein [Firmicutes bacterium]|nr:ketopantoate reductase family protein [Bacillota bacterium]
MRIAIMGAGALGTILGAYIAKAGYDVVLIDPYKEHVDALNEKGAHVIGKVDFVQPVKAITPDQMEGIYDLVIYLAKQTYNDVAIPQIMAHIDENSTVCVGQNGIPEYAVSAAIGEERVVGSPVGWGATFIGPGVSELTTKVENMGFTLGSLVGPVNDRVLKTKEILETMCETVVSDNLLGLRWTKLLMNSTFSGLSTALGTVFATILDNDDTMKLILKIGKECLDVAAGLGITLEDYEGYDFYQTFKRGNEKTNAESIAKIREIWQAHYLGVASMYQDLTKGRKCEIYDINGVVCESGRKCGVPTPVNDMVVKVVAGIQDGKYELSQDNIQFFKDLI